MNKNIKYQTMRPKNWEVSKKCERMCFDTVIKVLFGSTKLVAILDDELCGTTVVNKQVKTLSNREGCMEGHRTSSFLMDVFVSCLACVLGARAKEM